MFDSRAIANTIISIAGTNNIAITNLSLQKIAYFCHGWHLAAYGRPLCKQTFEAWQYGPVLQNIYREFKDCERAPIDRLCARVNPLSGERTVVPFIDDQPALAIIEACVMFYGSLRPGTLVEMSHDPDGPWDLCWNKIGGVNPGMRIENDSIETYFSQKQKPF